MATPAAHLPHFRLPARARLATTLPGSIRAGLTFAERIGDLPGIDTVESSADTLPREVRVYVRGPNAARSIRAPRGRLLCTISNEGVMLNGLDSCRKHQVLSRGWGRLVDDGVLVFLPRNDDELETCWSILRSAYDILFDASANDQRAAKVSIWDMPSFSRTTLQ